jgi:hypothetical protein
VNKVRVVFTKSKATIKTVTKNRSERVKKKGAKMFIEIISTPRVKENVVSFLDRVSLTGKGSLPSISMIRIDNFDVLKENILSIFVDKNTDRVVLNMNINTPVERTISKNPSVDRFPRTPF